MQTYVTRIDETHTFDWDDDGSSLYQAQLTHSTNVELDADMRTVLNRNRASAHVRVRDYSETAPVVNVDVDKRDALKLAAMFDAIANQLDDPFDD